VVVLRRALLVGIAGWVLTAAAVRSAPVYSSREQALSRAFPPPATIERKTHFLTDAEREKASRAARTKVESNLVVAYVGRTSKGILGTAYFDTHTVRTMPETLLVVVRPDVTGATLTTRVISDAARRVLALHAVIGEASPR
jgi:hypothetical protein